MSIGATWRELALRHGERAAIIDHTGTWSYRQLQSRIARFANALHGLGLNRGDRVALLAPDIREYLEADYGVMSAGLVRVPLDPRATRQDLVTLLRHAGATALVTHGSFAEKVDGLQGEVDGLRRVILIGGDGGLDYEDLLARASDRPPLQVDDDDIATLNFSGGTTGVPKATMLRHRNLLAVARNAIHGFEIGSDSRFLNVRPLWPIAQVILMSHLFAGATVILRRFDPEQLATLVQQSGATRTSLVPTQLVRCLDHLPDRDERLRRLEAIYVGGSRIPPAIFARALDARRPEDRRALWPDRGAGDLVSAAAKPRRPGGPGTADAFGRACAARLSGAVGPIGGDIRLRGRGEVLIRGGNVMAGYWRDEEATGAALRDGWLHTGDIGHFDDDGNLAIVGRIKEVIRSGSSTVIPKEVEDVIVLHPAVAEVAVIGLPDTEWGEAVTAFVVAKPGIAVTENDLMEHCRARLASYKKPRTIRFVARLPRSHYGKVLRAQLIALYSTLILASLMIFSYFAISSRMYVANCSPPLPIGSNPSVFNRCFISGNASTLAMSACSFRETSAGRFLGAHNPYHDTNSKPFIAGFLHRRNVGRGGRALEAGQPERLDLASLRQRQRGEHRIGEQVYLPAHEVGQRRGGALVGDHQRVEAGVALQAARWRDGWRSRRWSFRRCTSADPCGRDRTNP